MYVLPVVSYVQNKGYLLIYSIIHSLIHSLTYLLNIQSLNAIVHFIHSFIIFVY